MTLGWTLISRGVVVLTVSFLAVLSGSAGCSGDGAKASAGGEDGACPSGEVRSPEGECACPAATVLREEGGCQPAGLPLDLPCPPGEMPLEGGGCEPAGVSPEACGEGFEPDGKRGCNAIQPEDDCPEGLMAIPGETKCHEVAPCGSGTWGDIPVEANTVFVDGSYSGGGSNGTKEKPWTTIQAGINSASKGAIVAIAAGSYKESLLLNFQPVRLWGRCPSMVEVEGVDKKLPAILVFGSDRTEMRDLAIRGSRVGLVTLNSMDVVADRVWIHHTGNDGVRVYNDNGPASLTVSSSLIEAIAGFSVAVAGTSFTLSRSVVRDTVSPGHSAGVIAEEYLGERGSVTIRSSAITRTQMFGVALQKSIAQIDATLIRDIRPLADGTGGLGVSAFGMRNVVDSGGLTIRASVIEGAYNTGVKVSGPDLTIEDTVIRKTRLSKHGGIGRGISLQYNEPQNGKAGRGTMTLRNSLVEDNPELGIAIFGSDALIEGTIIRDSMRGQGVTVFHDEETGERAKATIQSSVIQRSVSSGILVNGSDATIETSIIADTATNQEGLHGTGIGIQRRSETLEPASAVVRSCLIERSVTAGVRVVGSDALIETSHVRDIQPDSLGTFGDGIAVFSLESPATAQLYGTLVESSMRAGVSSFGGHIVMDRIAVTCGALDMDGEVHNDADFVFDDRGGTSCGCPSAIDRCHVQSAGLQPPSALEPPITLSTD